jgi:hypothetical protein
MLIGSGAHIARPVLPLPLGGIRRATWRSSRQRSLKIERNQGLLLDDEDGVSIETDAFHGCAVPSRADTLRPSSRLHHDVSTERYWFGGTRP